MIEQKLYNLLVSKDSKLLNWKGWLPILLFFGAIFLLLSPVYMMFRLYVQIIGVILINIIDFCLIIPMCLYWIITKKNRVMQLEKWVNSKTNFFSEVYS